MRPPGGDVNVPTPTCIDNGPTYNVDVSVSHVVSSNSAYNDPTTGYARVGLKLSDPNGALDGTNNQPVATDDQGDATFPEFVYTPASSSVQFEVSGFRTGTGVDLFKTVNFPTCGSAPTSTPAGPTTTASPACQQTASATYNGSTLHVTGVLCSDGNGTTYLPDYPSKCDGTVPNCLPQTEYDNVVVPAKDYGSSGKDFSLSSPKCGYYQWDFYTGPEQKTVTTGTANYIDGTVQKNGTCTTPPSGSSSVPASPSTSAPVVVPPVGLTSPVATPSSSTSTSHSTPPTSGSPSPSSSSTTPQPSTSSNTGIHISPVPVIPGSSYPVQSPTSGHGTPFLRSTTAIVLAILMLLGGLALGFGGTIRRAFPGRP